MTENTDQKCQYSTRALGILSKSVECLRHDINHWLESDRDKSIISKKLDTLQENIEYSLRGHDGNYCKMNTELGTLPSSQGG